MIQKTKRVYTSRTKSFNPNVNSNWLAGSAYYDSTYPGNTNFAPTTFGKGKVFGLDNNYYDDNLGMLKGQSIYTLNQPYAKLNKFISLGSFINLFDFSSELSVYVYTYYKYTRTNSTAYVVFSTSTKISDSDLNDLNDSLSKSIDNQSQIDTKALNTSKMQNLLESVLSPKYGMPGFIAGGIVGGLIDSKTIGQALSSGVLGFAKAMATSTITNALGIGMVGSFIAAPFVSEMFEVMTGQDNHFGFGGELVGFDDQGNPQYGQAIGFVQGIENTIATAYHNLTGDITSFGDNFSDFNYSDKQINSAIQQSANSANADNPSDSFGNVADHTHTNEFNDVSPWSGIDYGGSDDFGGGDDGTGVEADSGSTGEGMGFL